MTHARPRSGLLVASATALMGKPRLIPLPDVDTSGSSFSAVDNEPPLRWQRAVHLAPAAGLGVARRAIFSQF